MRQQRMNFIGNNKAPAFVQLLNSQRKSVPIRNAAFHTCMKVRKDLASAGFMIQASNDEFVRGQTHYGMLFLLLSF